MRFYKYTIIANLIFQCLYCFSANKIDSLLNELDKSTNDLKLASIYLEIGDLFEYNNPDSAIYFYNKALQICFKHTESGDSSFKIISKSQLVYNYLAIVYHNKGDYFIAKQFYEKSLELGRKLNGIMD